MTVARVPIPAVSLAVMLCLASCGDNDRSTRRASASATPSTTTTPTATPKPTMDIATLLGVYDLQATSVQREFSATAIGVVERGDDGSLRLELDFDANNHVGVDVTFVGDSEVLLTGWGTFQGDIGFTTEGTGTIRVEADGLRRISGTVNGYGSSRTQPPPPPIDFVLERPVHPDVTAFGGVYRFDFDRSPSGCGGPSHTWLELRFADDGHGESRIAAADRGTGDSVFGRFTPGLCRLSPSGQVRCGMLYEHSCDTPPAQYEWLTQHYLQLAGRLDSSNGEIGGAGSVERNLFLTLLGWQSWTAHRRP